MAIDYRVNLTGSDNLSKTLDNVKNAIDGVTSKSQRLDEIKGKFEAIENSSKPLKSELRQLQGLLSEMNFEGLANTDVFTEIASKAGEIKDAIDDARAATSAYASDTSNLAAITSGFQGVMGAATALTGTMGLLGVENDKVQQAILKVQSAMAVLNGVQALSNALNKDSALMLKLKQIAMAANTAATKVNTGATIANNVATKAGTIATKAWNVATAIAKALVGDFSGLLIVGAGALATYAIATSDSADEMEKAGEEADEFKQKQDALKEKNEKVAESAGEAAAKFTTLKIQYGELRTEGEKQEWIKANKNNFDALGLSVLSVHDADKIFIKDAAIVESLLWRRANAAAAAAAAFDEMKGIHKKYRTNYTAGEKVTKEAAKNNNLLAVTDYYLVGENEEFLTLTPEGAKKFNAQNQKTKNIELKKQEKSYNDAIKDQNDADKELAQNGYGNRRGSGSRGSSTSRGGKHGSSTSRGSGGRSDKKTTTTPPKKETPKITFEEIEKLTDEQLKNLSESKLKDYIDYLEKLKEEGKNGKALSQSDFEKTNKQIARLTPFYEAQKKKNTPEEVEAVKYVAGSLEDLINKKSQLEEKLKGGLIPATDIEKTKTEISNLAKQIEEKEISLGLKTTFAKGSIADLQEQISKLQDRLNNENLSIETRLKINENITNLQSQIDAITNGTITIKAPVEPQYIEQGGKEDKRQSYANAQTQIEQVKSDFELKIIGKDEVLEQIKAVNEELKKLGLEPIYIHLEPSGFEKTMEAATSVGSAFTAMGTAFSAVGNDSVAAMAQIINATAQMVQQVVPLIMKLIATKQGEAMAEGAVGAAKLPFPANVGAIASIIAVIASTFASIKSASEKFEHGGIVGGNSYHGDNILARLNSGEGVLTRQGVRNLGLLAQSKTQSENSNLTFKIKGGDLYATLQNYGKIKHKQIL